MIAWYVAAVVAGVMVVWASVGYYRRQRRLREYDERLRRAVQRTLRDQKRAAYPWESDVQDTG